MTPPLFEHRQPVEMCNLTPLFSYTLCCTLFSYTFSLTPFLLLYHLTLFLKHLISYSLLLNLFSYTLFPYTFSLTLFSLTPFLLHPFPLQPRQRSSSTAQLSLRVCFTAWLHFACIPSLQTSENHCLPLNTLAYHYIQTARPTS